MVYYFVSEVVSPPMVMYMGEDKFENEELLKWGFPEDVWFHVDKMSSAHVYLRLPMGMSVEEIPPDVLSDCAQLVKANSIEGCKTNNVAVVYTPFSNLKKTQGMDVGQVGFHDPKMVHCILVEKKRNEVVNRLNKTQKQRKPDLRKEREERDREERRVKRQQQQAERQRQKEEEEKQKKESDLKSYKSIMKEENMKPNQYDADVDYKSFEDDFM